MLLRLLWCLLVIPTLAHAFVADNAEDVCANASVIVCENFENRTLGTASSTLGASQYKNTGWAVSDTGMQIVNTDQFDGTKSLLWTYPAGTGGGGYFDIQPAARQSYYVRFYMKNSSNWVWSDNGNKMSYIGSPSYGDNVIFNQGIWGGGTPAWRPQVSLNDEPWHYLSYSWPLNEWVCVEYHATANSVPSATDGSMEVWIFDTLRSNVPAINMNATDTTFNSIKFSAYYNNDGGAAHPTMYRWIDNIVISTTRIGCLGAPPPADTVPPTTPTTPTASASGTSISLTWGLGSDGGSGLAGTVILNCTGAACTPTTTVTTIASPGASYTANGLTASTVYGWAFRSQDHAGNLSAATTPVYATTGSTFLTTLGTYSFDTDGADLGTVFDAGYTSFDPCKVLSQRLLATTVNVECHETYNAVTTPDDQWAQLTVNALTGIAADAEFGVWLRMANPPTDTGYLCFLSSPADVATKAAIGQYTAGAFVYLASENSSTWAAGDKVFCEATGASPTTIKLYQIRGTVKTLLLTYEDSASPFTSGKTGVYAWIATGGSLTDAQADDFAMGGFSGTPPVPPSITTVAADATGASLTFGAVTPTTIRVYTGTNSLGVYQSVVEPIASFPAGRYTRTWGDGLDFACFVPRDSLGVEHSDQQLCDSLIGIVAPLDVAPPVMSNGQPTGTVPAGTTSTTISVTIDKPASCRYDTSDVAYASMANAMTRISLTASATVSGLTDGSSTVYYVHCQSTDTLDGVHPTLTSLPITVLVAAATDLTPPVRASGFPSGVLASGTTSVAMQLVTNENATCKYDTTAGIAYGSMASTFSTTGTTTHSHTIGSLTDGTTHTYYVRCQDSIPNANTTDFIITWSITALPPDVTPPSRSAGSPSGTLAVDTPSTTMSLTTDENATCRFALVPGIAYASMPTVFTTTGTTSHSVSVTGLTNNTTFTRYVRCQDTTGNANTTDYVITWFVAAPVADVTVPSTVTNLVCTALSQSQQECVWTAATDNVAVAGYQVFVSTGACSTYNLVSQPTPATITLLALSPNTVHCTKVKAIDTSGNVSAAFSNIATVTTQPQLDFTPPSDMTNLRLLGAYRNSVVLKSDPGTDDHGSVTTTIEISPAGCGAFVFVYSNLALQAFIPNLTPGTTYCARGKFSDGTNLSVNYSNTVIFTTQSAGLTQPRPPVPFGQPRLPRN